MREETINVLESYADLFCALRKHAAAKGLWIANGTSDVLVLRGPAALSYRLAPDMDSWEDFHTFLFNQVGILVEGFNLTENTKGRK